MTADTVYNVFLALSSEEKEHFIVLVNKQCKKATQGKRNKIKVHRITKDEAIEYLLKTVFKATK